MADPEKNSKHTNFSSKDVSSIFVAELIYCVARKNSLEPVQNLRADDLHAKIR